MPVIGRLDDQVEAVLINPLKRRPAAEEAEREQTPVPPAPAAAKRDEAETAAKKREADAVLPVWLL